MSVQFFFDHGHRTELSAHPKSSVSLHLSTDGGFPGSSVHPDGMWRRPRSGHPAPALAWAPTRRVLCALGRPLQRFRRRRRSKNPRYGPTRTTRRCRGSTQTSPRQPRRIGRPDGQAAPVRPSDPRIARSRTARAVEPDRSWLGARRHRCGSASARGRRRPSETPCLGAAAEWLTSGQQPVCAVSSSRRPCRRRRRPGRRRCPVLCRLERRSRDARSPGRPARSAGSGGRLLHALS